MRVICHDSGGGEALTLVSIPGSWSSARVDR